MPRSLSLAISLILLATYGFSLVFTLGTHRKVFLGAPHEARQETPGRCGWRSSCFSAPPSSWRW